MNDLGDLLITLPLLGACASFAFLTIMLRTQAARWALDHPNHRSLHSQSMPRIGGIAIFSVLTPLLLATGFVLAGALTVLLCALSFLDDRHKLSIGLRFAAHAVAAAAFAWATLPGLSWIALLCAALALMWMANLFNFMDGSDGLAGGMAVTGFGAYAVAAWLGQQEVFAVGALCVSSCTAAFLYFNFPPARVFMGDAGSIPLGFLAACMGLSGWHTGIWPLWFPILVFSPFIVDTSLTLIRRTLRGERIWQAHRSHYYQRLIQSGWSHRKTALIAYGLMLICGISAVSLIFANTSGQSIVLLLIALLYMVLIVVVERISRRYSEQQKTHEF